MSGTLSLKIIQAQLLKNTDLIGKMDPYVIVKHENEKQFQYKTKISKNGHLNPQWNETLFIRCKIDQIINFDVMDYDFGKKDDLICQGQYTVQSTNGKSILDIHCQFYNSKVGELQVEFEFIADEEEQVDLYYNYKNVELINIQQQLIKIQKSECDKRKSLIQQQNSKEKQLLDHQVSIQINNQNLQKQIEELKSKLKEEEENLELQSFSLISQQDELNQKNQQLQNLKDEYEKTIKHSFEGKLTIKNIQVSMRLDTGSIFDKMDPYVIFQVGSEVVRTKDAENAGMNAKFSEEFIIDVKDSDILVMAVYDDNVVSDDIAGQTAVSILQLLKENNRQQAFSLYLRGNKTGNLTFYYNYSQSQ